MGIFDMKAEINNDFTTAEIIHVQDASRYENGEFLQADGERVAFSACIQPLSGREIDFLARGGERISDARKLYITAPIENLTLQSRFEFFGQLWKVVEFDHRPENTYCRITVMRYDL